ncbi:hypothetical protein CR513_50849, partial [Mucuna pruriens]
MNRRRRSRRSRVSIARRKKAAQNANPDPHDLYRTAPSIVGAKALSLKPLVPLYLRSYDPNARCDYHGGVVGHATERRWSLKHKVQDLLDGGLLGFQEQGRDCQRDKPRKQGEGGEPKQTGRELDGLAKIVALQESLRRSRLDYTRPVKKRRPREDPSLITVETDEAGSSLGNQRGRAKAIECRLPDRDKADGKLGYHKIPTQGRLPIRATKNNKRALRRLVVGFAK